MATLALNKLFLPIVFLVLIIEVSQSKAALDARYYDQTCPEAEKIILDTVRNASMHDPKVPARILRMFFHDCFVRGCDASVLLDLTPQNKAEKDGPPNISLQAFYVIDDAKAKLERACPQTVSCADIITIAARDVVAMEGKMEESPVQPKQLTYQRQLSTFRNSIQSFAKRGLGVKDLVALSGGHTLGFSHCSSFQARLHNFSSVHDIDPSLNSEFAETLRKKCPKPNKDRNAGQFLDSTATRWIVESFAKDQTLFFKEFAASMVKLGNVRVIENGEVRLKCRVVIKMRINMLASIILLEEVMPHPQT
ncbi:Peroxidase, putative [Theobroma cacao]|uniref:Peroxidase n=1 Tax=Theobroma cacao TaxID=3641 RepID=A0A061G1F5_THECC|nr:Peroxidase, putative [Theobroma cacao]